MNAETSLWAKLASPAFSDDERGALVAVLNAAQANAQATQQQAVKQASEQAPNFDEAQIIKEASNLSDEDLAGALEKAAHGIPEAEQDAIVKQAYQDVVEPLMQRKQAYDVGYWMFQGFDAAAQEKLAHQQTKQASHNLAQKAPVLASLLGR